MERVLRGLHIDTTSESHIVVRGHIGSHRLPEEGLRLRGRREWLVRHGLIELDVHLLSPFLETFEHGSLSSLRLVPPLQAYLMLLVIRIKLLMLRCGKLVTHASRGQISRTQLFLMNKLALVNHLTCPSNITLPSCLAIHDRNHHTFIRNVG